MKTSNDIRNDFLQFFKSKGHEIVASSPLVPGNDPTLLFTNAGMVQFKDVFLGAEKRSYKKATSSQRCVRAGGKHNDLDSVGYTARHHTFFEMLGNFSFGDYFKHDAIVWAWELLTEVWKLPKDKLLVTIYHTDDEAFEIWNKIVGLPRERIIRIGDNKGAAFASDNFWQMADTGPCGPCSEIFYDHGDHIAGGPPGSPDEDGDRFIEIWNNVFMQFDRQADGSLVPLPAPCVDTGMGLERVSAVLQHVHSNYEIDLFQHLIQAAAELTGTDNLENKSLRVIADHIRACAFLIVDGVLPSNEGRGYVLRRIIRRALRHGHKLGLRDLFFHKMVQPLVDVMGDAYPELKNKQAVVGRALKGEEERFAETLGYGMKLFEDIVARGIQQIPGHEAFKLYDTYGFPVDLTADVARERNLTVDMLGFEAAMEAQRDRARAASNFAGTATLPAELVKTLPISSFLGYEKLQIEDTKVLAILHDNQSIGKLQSGDRAVVILDRTPFYAESGGQVGDQGELKSATCHLRVHDTQKLAGVYHGHVIQVERGELQVGDTLLASVDQSRRAATILNHSATHLMHSALRAVLGEHVQQKGSLVSPDRLRFDFSHFQPMSADEISQTEKMVNDAIRGNASANAKEMSYKDALDFGAIALFGEKYGEHVRVMKMGSYSTELCGGTHVNRTGDIGIFKIIGESGVASGVRRIEAVTGANALRHIAKRDQVLDELERMLSAANDDVIEKLTSIIEKQKRLEKELESYRTKNTNSLLEGLLLEADEANGIRIISKRVVGLDSKSLREGLDFLKSKLGHCVILLGGAHEGKLSLVAGVNGAALQKIKAGDLLAHVAGQLGGKGGGRSDMAQGGAEDREGAQKVFADSIQWVRDKLI